jgi:hypothetical protein
MQGTSCSVERGAGECMPVSFLSLRRVCMTGRILAKCLPFLRGLELLDISTNGIGGCGLVALSRLDVVLCEVTTRPGSKGDLMGDRVRVCLCPCVPGEEGLEPLGTHWASGGSAAGRPMRTLVLDGNVRTPPCATTTPLLTPLLTYSCQRGACL